MRYVAPYLSCVVLFYGCGRLGYSSLNSASVGNTAVSPAAQGTESAGASIVTAPPRVPVWTTFVGSSELRMQWNTVNGEAYEAQLFRPDTGSWSTVEESSPGLARMKMGNVTGSFKWRLRVVSPTFSDWIETDPLNVWWNMAELYFTIPTIVQGLSDIDKECRMQHLLNGSYLALCSRARGPDDGGLADRKRLHVLTASDPTVWSYRGPMLSTWPDAYRARNSYVSGSGYTQYFSQLIGTFQQLPNGSIWAASPFYFQWTGPDWNYLTASWTSPDGLTWSGYNGTSDAPVLRLGNEYHANGQAMAIGSQIKQDGNTSVYIYQTCHNGECPLTIRRIISADRINWIEDAGFQIPLATAYPSTYSHWVYSFSENQIALSMFTTPSGTCSEANGAKWQIAWSSSGLFDTFSPPKTWHVLQDTTSVVNPCAISSATFLRDGNAIRIFYKIGNVWFSALSVSALDRISL